MKKLQTTGRLLLASMLCVMASCTETAKTENKETEQIDSVTTSLEQSNKELEEQTKKVEASLEKLDEGSAKTN